MKSKKSSKSRNIKRHFWHRCVQRLGFPIDNKELVKKIQNFKSDDKTLRFHKRQSLSRTVWIYYHESNDRYYKIIYDKNRKEIVTIFPYRKSQKENKHDRI